MNTDEAQYTLRNAVDTIKANDLKGEQIEQCILNAFKARSQAHSTNRPNNTNQNMNDNLSPLERLRMDYDMSDLSTDEIKILIEQYL